MNRLFSSMLLAGTLAAAPVLSACNKPANEPDYQARVNDSLKDAQLKDVKADWKADEKALHLSGEVEKAADKARAAELAKQVVGTSGRVVDEVKVEGSNIDEVDNRIEKDLDAAFKEDDQWDRDNLDLTFHSEGGCRDRHRDGTDAGGQGSGDRARPPDRRGEGRRERPGDQAGTRQGAGRAKAKEVDAERETAIR